MGMTQVDGFTPPRDGDLLVVEADGTAVAVAALDGRLVAFADRCPHAGCSLAGGDLDGRTVRCPCHFARFDIATGAVVDGPATRGVQTWEATFEDGQLRLEGPRPPSSASDSADTGSARPAPPQEDEGGTPHDVTVLIASEHDAFRRQFTALKDLAEEEALAEAWGTLVDLLEIHASAEEHILYPELVLAGEDVVDQAEDAVRDHNEIRDSLRDVPQDVGSEAWWAAVRAVQEINEEHLQQEERDVLPLLAERADASRREELGGEWLAFHEEHRGGRGLTGNKADPRAVVERHGA